MTHYRVLKRFTMTPNAFPCTLLQVSLQTGRTHQIRVHMAHVGHPVIGDTTYGKQPPNVWHAWGIKRQLLHAYALRFLHPTTHQPVELTAPLPEDMHQWVPMVDLLHQIIV